MWRFCLAAVLVLVGPVTTRAADGWTHLRLGMTAEETVAAVGDPLIKTSGGGFEIWIYDHSAEALFYGGPLIGWTSPGSGPSGKRVVDVWQATPAGPDAPKFLLPRWKFPSKQNGPVRAQNGVEQDARVPLYRPWQ